jgi:uncharacterized protein YeaO (DUF488 family)
VEIRTRRAYEPASEEDGKRFLVDRIWPRGVRRERLAIVRWAREVAPSKGLCGWFGHDQARWTEFKRRYFEELDHNAEAWRPLLEASLDGRITLVFGAKDVRHNQALALKEYLESKASSR